MSDPITIPVVTDDFDGQLAAIDQAIREAAADFKFSFVADAPTFDQIYKVPDLVYKLIQHYTMRGFICTYDGESGAIKFSWDFPNMSWLEAREVTRAIPEMIPSLGIAFRAGLLYLCMTNGTDLRMESNATLQDKIAREIKAAATLGNLSLTFGFPTVPAPAVQNLFDATFRKLEDTGFTIQYSVHANVFVLKWSTTVPASFFGGQKLEVDVA